MKIIVMIMVIVFMMGCMLDEQYQEQQSKHITTWEIKDKPVKVEYVYIDCNGDVITDPEIIEGIENN